MATRRDVRDVVPPPGDIDAGEGPLSPAAILRAQAETWTQRTHGDLVAEVEPVRASSDRLAYAFSFVVPALDGYRYRLFRIEHGVDFYPLLIGEGRASPADWRPSQENVSPNEPPGYPAMVHDEDALYAELQRIFAAPATLNVVRQLRALVAEQRAAREKAADSAR